MSSIKYEILKGKQLARERSCKRLGGKALALESLQSSCRGEASHHLSIKITVTESVRLHPKMRERQKREIRLGRKGWARKTSWEKRYAGCVLEEREDLIKKKEVRGFRKRIAEVDWALTLNQELFTVNYGDKSQQIIKTTVRGIYHYILILQMRKRSHTEVW